MCSFLVSYFVIGISYLIRVFEISFFEFLSATSDIIAVFFRRSADPLSNGYYRTLLKNGVFHAVDKAIMTSLAPCFEQETDQSRPDPLPISQPISPPPAKPIEIQCLCPFCGAFNSGILKPCAHCEMEDTTAARDANRQRSGLWFVMPPNGPASAGMNFDAIVALISRQLILPRTVVRGPTTGQLWRLASKIRGLSREFGHCYACGGDIRNQRNRLPALRSRSDGSRA